MKKIILLLTFVSLNSFAGEVNCKISIYTNKQISETTNKPKVFTFRGIRTIKAHAVDYSISTSLLIDNPYFRVVAAAGESKVFSPVIAITFRKNGSYDPVYSSRVDFLMKKEGRSKASLLFDIPGSNIKGRAVVDCSLAGFEETDDIEALPKPTNPEYGQISCHAQISDYEDNSARFNGVAKFDNQTHEAPLLRSKLQEELYLYTKNNQTYLKYAFGGRPILSIKQYKNEDTSTHLRFSHRKITDGDRTIRSECINNL